MSTPILDKQLQSYRSELNGLLYEMQQLAADINNPGLRDTTDRLRRNISEPFLFVVVGEVKAGKSSFVNALLGAEVCTTDIEPCTDMVQQIVYSAEKFTTQVEPNLRKIGLPIEILKDISIVDTPGTNTIVEEHQIITERYIPNSDLTFFVLFAKNPHQKSAWDFLDYVSTEWRKKVVFILQQADLLKPSDLDRNIGRVEEYAHQKQIQAPVVFTTSAEREFNGEENSGFEEVRSYIRNMVASGESYKIKLRSVSQTTQKIIETLAQDIEALQAQLTTDQTAAEKIRNRIAAAQRRSRSEIDSLVERLAARYGTISDRIKTEFRESLSVFTVIRKAFVGIFNKEASIQAWIKGFQDRCQIELKSSLEEVSIEGAQNFVDSIRQLLEGLTYDLNSIQTNQIHSSNISLKILERRQEVIESVRTKVSQLMTDQGMVRSINSNAEDMAVEIVGGVFIAIAGTVMSVLQFAVAETIMNALGIAFAGIGVVLFAVGVAWQRNQVIQKFEIALDREKGKFQGDVSDRLNQKLSLIYEEIERIFVQFYDYVEREEQAIQPILERYTTIQHEAQQLFGKMATQLN